MSIVKDTRPIMVSIKCMTYNHEKYIRDALEGFVMQKTNFRFEAIVHDDASTDGTAAIIREYAEKYPDIIKPIYETENQYSKHDGSLRRIMNEACQGKYIALCEGDDYWTDPNKLQIQVDFLENHPDYSMCWHRAVLISAIDGKEKDDYRGYTKDTTCTIEDMIERGGEFCPTASLCYKKELLSEAPEELFNQYVGDYPLQLYLSFVGKIYYMDRKMSVYRIDVQGSWLQRNHKDKDYRLVRHRLWFYEKKLLDDFNRYSFYRYDKSFKQRENFYLFRSFWATRNYKMARYYWYKMNVFKRPYGVRRILYLHGYSVLKNKFDIVKTIKNFLNCFRNEK